MKVISFILRVDKNRFKDLLKDVKNSAYHGRDDYRTTITAASQGVRNF